MIKDFVVLSRLEGYQFKNKLKFSLKERPIGTLALIVLGGLFFYGYIALAYWLIKFIYFQEIYGVLLASKLVQILLYIALGISLVSCLTTAMTHLYLSKDLEFQFSLPVPFNTWILHRFFQIYMQSVWMLLLFGSPLILLFFYFSETPLMISLLGVLIFALLASFPIFLATLLCMLLVKVFPARRIHQVFLVVTVVIASIMVFLFRYLEPEKLVGPGGLEEFRGLVDLIDLDRFSWNPAAWAYRAIVSASQGAYGEIWTPLAMLLGLFAVAMTLFLMVANRLYRSSWDRALQSLSGEGDLKAPDAKMSRLSNILGHPRLSQEARELILFLRDPSQWSQIFVLAALLGLCLFSLTKIPFTPFGMSRLQLALAGTAMADFICLSIASRFVFTSFSADGMAIWLMKTAPEGWFRFMRSKFIVYGIPTIFFSVVLMTASGMIMKLDQNQLMIVAIHSFWDASVLVALSLSLGMLFINPGIENPLKMVISPGGVLLMTSGLFITGLHVFLRLSEGSRAFNGLLMHIGWPDVQDGKAIWYYLGLVLLECVFFGYLLRRGINHLRRGDFG